MSKKTFEVTRKVTVSVKHLQDAFLWRLPISERLDGKQLKTFYASYDWDKILNSAAFKKSATEYLTACSFIESDNFVNYFYANNYAVFEKIGAAYNKYRDNVIVAEPVIERIITLKGRNSCINDVIAGIECEVSVDITKIE